MLTENWKQYFIKPYFCTLMHRCKYLSFDFELADFYIQSFFEAFSKTPFQNLVLATSARSLVGMIQV